MATEFVGRDRELAILADALGAALNGEPQVVMCEGEAGVGKTRLAREILRLANKQEVLCAWGSAAEASGAPPYWPWRQVLRGISDHVDLSALAEAHGLTPELARFAPDLIGSVGAQTTWEASLEDRFRQLDAVSRLLRHASVHTALVIVLDDVHWADEASLLLLHHITRSMSDERFLVVVNSRDTGERDDVLLTRIAREPVTRRLHLRGLEAPEVRIQLSEALGREVDERELAEVQALTGGNPFFVGEVALAIAERRDGRHSPVTPSVRDTISGRLQRLPPACVALLEAAAVQGRSFSASAVADVVGVTVDGCLPLLDDATAARLVEPGEGPGEHRFVHALVRDTIEEGLSTRNRVRLHRAAAAVIERHHPAPRGRDLFDLARHWSLAAVDDERGHASGWIRRAGEEAMRQLAYEEAARLFRLALQVGDAAIDDLDRCELLLAEGAAAHLSADLHGCLRVCIEAADVARTLDRPDLLAEAALVTEAVGMPDVDLSVRRLCEEAIEALGPSPTPLLARVTARLAQALTYLRDVDGAGPASELALAMAEETGDPLATAAALQARQLVCADPKGVDQRSDLADRMLALSRQTRHPTTELWARLWRTDVRFQRGDLVGVTVEIDAIARCIRQIQGPRERFEMLRCQAALAQAQARFTDADRLVHEAFAIMAHTGRPAPYAIRAAITNLIGRHVGQAETSLAANGDLGASEMTRESYGLIGLLSYAHALVTADRHDEAAAAYRLLGPPDSWDPVPHVVLFSYAFGVAVAIPLGLTADVDALHVLLDPFRGHHVVSGAGAVAYFGPVELWLGSAARHLGRLDAAVIDLGHAAAVCDRSGTAGFAVEARYELAAALVQRDAPGDCDRARSLAALAATQAAALGMDRVSGMIATLQSGLGTSSPPLTPREGEVAVLVGQGLTNREIADVLVLSERTAQNHVQHILTKLGLANRSQVAVWVTTRR